MKLLKLNSLDYFFEYIIIKLLVVVSILFILLSVLSLIWEDLFHLLSPFCHQISDRSFVINNFQIGICARCFGIYFGVIFFGVCTLLKNKMTYFIILSVIISIISILLKWQSVDMNNILRLISGFFIGSLSVFLISIVLRYIEIMFLKLLIIINKYEKSSFK